MATALRVAGRSLWRLLLFAAVVAACPSCRQHDRATSLPRTPPRVIVVAPVLNLSGSQDFDPLKITDLIASEFLSFEGIAVIPVNLTLAELERQGKYAVETPEDARELARALGADATVVTAVTEYSPYSPPVVGLIMQWYSAAPPLRRPHLDPASASPTADGSAVELSDGARPGPRWQVQRVFNAASEELREQIRSFAAERDGHQSPYGWRKYLESQELYVRYCGWATIRTMLKLDQADREAVEPREAKS